MNNRTTILILSAVLIAAVLSGCVQETSETGAVVLQQGAPTAATPDAAQTASVAEVTRSSASAGPEIRNWKYVSYRNLSISNAPALNQTARITFSIIPDKDIEILLVHVSFLDGFEFVNVEGDRLLTWGKDKTPYSNLDRSAKWCPTNLSKGEMYQFSATIKAVKTGNWTITGLDWENEVYVSVFEDSACIRDEPFPKPPSVTYFLDESELNKSEIKKALAKIPINSKHNGITVYRSSHVPINATTTPSKPPKYNVALRPTPCPTSCPLDVNLDDKTYAGMSYYWNGTAWVEGENQP